ncbi:unnamed protein product [Psylliodes chrysocephalus]|uniref:Uncharacterized protein n=1 Tax=Psylliodes chrysocephalus TaxID=3402493 RepID=A0A9P0CYH5_9CUCU|nr:unnamed protein product [Psylliodes chrysocephala]
MGNETTLPAKPSLGIGSAVRRVFKARQTKFKESIIQSNIPLLIDCLGLGVDPNTEFDDGNYALHIATEKCDYAILRILLNRQNIEIDKKNWFGVTALMVACEEATLACNSESKLTMFKLLIANGMDRHQLHPIEGRNCLHYVAISGYIPLAQYLITLNMESDLFVRDITGRTPMDLALDHLNFMVFHLLKLAYLKKRISPQSRTQLKLRKSMSRRMV